jgi:hypothetical protein
MTEKQQLQKDRAYFKFVLVGLPKPIQKRSLTPTEIKLWDNIMEARLVLLNSIDETSRQLGLKVPENRCYLCGKEGTEAFENGSLGTIFTCKKHSIE